METKQCTVCRYHIDDADPHPTCEGCRITCSEGYTCVHCSALKPAEFQNYLASVDRYNARKRTERASCEEQDQKQKEQQQQQEQQQQLLTAPCNDSTVPIMSKEQKENYPRTSHSELSSPVTVAGSAFDENHMFQDVVEDSITIFRQPSIQSARGTPSRPSVSITPSGLDHPASPVDHLKEAGETSSSTTGQGGSHQPAGCTTNLVNAQTNPTENLEPRETASPVRKEGDKIKTVPTAAQKVHVVLPYSVTEVSRVSTDSIHKASNLQKVSPYVSHQLKPRLPVPVLQAAPVRQNVPGDNVNRPFVIQTQPGVAYIQSQQPTVVVNAQHVSMVMNTTQSGPVFSPQDVSVSQYAAVTVSGAVSEASPVVTIHHMSQPESGEPVIQVQGVVAQQNVLGDLPSMPSERQQGSIEARSSSSSSVLLVNQSVKQSVTLCENTSKEQHIQQGSIESLKSGSGSMESFRNVVDRMVDKICSTEDRLGHDAVGEQDKDSGSGRQGGVGDVVTEEQSEFNKMNPGGDANHMSERVDSLRQDHSVKEVCPTGNDGDQLQTNFQSHSQISDNSNELNIRILDSFSVKDCPMSFLDESIQNIVPETEPCSNRESESGSSVHQAVQSEVGHQAVQSEVGHRAVQSEVGHQAVQSEVGHQAVQSEVGHRAMQSEVGHRAVQSEVGHQAVQSEVGHQAVQSEVGHRAVQSEVGEMSKQDVKTKNPGVQSLDELCSQAFYQCCMDACCFNCVCPKVFENHLSSVHPLSAGFVCVHCGHVAPCPRTLLTHLHCHVDVALVKCNYAGCCFQTDQAERLLQHFHVDHFNAVEHTCVKCYALFESVLDLIIHLKSNFVSAVKCPHCPAKDITKRKILKHMKQEHPTKGTMVSVSKYIVCHHRTVSGWPISPLARSRLKSDEEQQQPPMEEESTAASPIHDNTQDNPSEQFLSPEMPNITDVKYPREHEPALMEQLSELDDSVLEQFVACSWGSGNNEFLPIMSVDASCPGNSAEIGSSHEDPGVESQDNECIPSICDFSDGNNPHTDSDAEKSDGVKESWDDEASSFVHEDINELDYNATTEERIRVKLKTLKKHFLSPDRIQAANKGAVQKINVCCMCEFYTTSNGFIYSHIRKWHSIKDMFECSECKEIVAQDGIIQHHTNRHENSDEKYLPASLINTFCNKYIKKSFYKDFQKSFRQSFRMLKGKDSSKKDTPKTADPTDVMTTRSKELHSARKGNIKLSLKSDIPFKGLKKKFSNNPFNMPFKKRRRRPFWTTEGTRKIRRNKRAAERSASVKRSRSEEDEGEEGRPAKLQRTGKDSKKAVGQIPGYSDDADMDDVCRYPSPDYHDSNKQDLPYVRVNVLNLDLDKLCKVSNKKSKQLPSERTSIQNIPPASGKVARPVKKKTNVSDLAVKHVASCKKPRVEMDTCSVASSSFGNKPTGKKKTQPQKIIQPKKIKLERRSTDETVPRRDFSEIDFSDPNYEFRCKYCTYRRGTLAQFISHVSYHTHHKPYGCGHCRAKFFSHSRVLRHIREDHPKNAKSPVVKMIANTIAEDKCKSLATMCFIPKNVEDVCLNNRLAKRKEQDEQKKASKSSPRAKPQMKRKIAVMRGKKEREMETESTESDEVVVAGQALYLCPYCRTKRPLMTWSKLVIEICYHIHYKPFKCCYCNELDTASTYSVQKHVEKEHPGREVKIAEQRVVEKEQIIKKLLQRSVDLSRKHKHGLKKKQSAKLKRKDDKPADTSGKGKASGAVGSRGIVIKREVIQDQSVSFDTNKPVIKSPREKKANTSSKATSTSSSSKFKSTMVPQSPEDMVVKKPCQLFVKVRKGKFYKYQCLECDYSIENIKSIYSHMNKHQPNVFKCFYCDFATYPRSAIVVHQKTHHKFMDFKVINLLDNINSKSHR